MTTVMTPYLPKITKEDIKDWRSRGTYNNAFYRLIDQVGNVTCNNCGDSGFILVSFTRAGPFQEIPNHKSGEILTYFEGNQFAGKGWYIVVKTNSYDCPECRK